ncbi:hypothetical protein CY34DRAFT_639788 [Suillus luteus UH-Slu-Lm8-n1]|uniref:Uncharacterized protein n=1 Tax=Suillus luteus UH-Slu-Lm8-n1 TaxID=930992 RepID=A0A0D0ARA6_9AGAM|nr:hypothetical protein CY34DRAFT_639788 [Suillus luteus UH-Slu-Lm8-n1]
MVMVFTPKLLDGDCFCRGCPVMVTTYEDNPMLETDSTSSRLGSISFRGATYLGRHSKCCGSTQRHPISQPQMHVQQTMQFTQLADLRILTSVIFLASRMGQDKSATFRSEAAS